MRILALVTSNNICDLLKNIENEKIGFQYDCVKDIKEFEYYLDIRNYDFVLLNIKEVDLDNELLEILSDLKKTSKYIQILYIKAKSEGTLNNLERTNLLNKGIFYSIDEDDYTNEYIQALFNSSISISKNESVIREGELLVDIKNEYITYGDREISLEGKPFEVFVFLLKRKNEIITKEELLHSLWVEPELVTPSVIDVCIKIIRQRIDKPLNISTIEFIKRRGFRFVLKTD